MSRTNTNKCRTRKFAQCQNVNANPRHARGCQRRQDQRRILPANSECGGGNTFCQVQHSFNRWEVEVWRHICLQNALFWIIMSPCALLYNDMSTFLVRPDLRSWQGVSIRDLSATLRSWASADVECTRQTQGRDTIRQKMAVSEKLESQRRNVSSKGEVNYDVSSLL